MSFTTADIFALIGSSPVDLTLSWRTVRRSASGVVNHQVDPIRFLESGKSVPSCIVAMSKTAASELTPEWSIIVNGESRPVLEVSDDYSGIVQVYLGDAETC